MKRKELMLGICLFAASVNAKEILVRVTDGISSQAFFADDDVVVDVNGIQAYASSFHSGAGSKQVEFTAKPGDRIAMKFYDTYGTCRAFGDVWLESADWPAVKVKIAAGANYGCKREFKPDSRPFDVREFTLPDVERKP